MAIDRDCSDRLEDLPVNSAARAMGWCQLQQSLLGSSLQRGFVIGQWLTLDFETMKTPRLHWVIWARSKTSVPVPPERWFSFWQEDLLERRVALVSLLAHNIDEVHV